LDDSVLTEAERKFLQELDTRGVRFLVVGLAAATLQGANTSTVDVDLWFETIADPRIGEAARAAGGVWVSGSFGMQPPTLGGALGDRFDVVLLMSGLEAFDAEFARSKEIAVEGVTLRVLPLDRILASKRAAGRPKDIAVIPALEEALAALDEPDS
jgi:predicted nucleotidyltransferase